VAHKAKVATLAPNSGDKLLGAGRARGGEAAEHQKAQRAADGGTRLNNAVGGLDGNIIIVGQTIAGDGEADNALALAVGVSGGGVLDDGAENDLRSVEVAVADDSDALVGDAAGGAVLAERGSGGHGAAGGESDDGALSGALDALNAADVQKLALLARNLACGGREHRGEEVSKEGGALGEYSDVLGGGLLLARGLVVSHRAKDRGLKGGGGGELGAVELGVGGLSQEDNGVGEEVGAVAIIGVVPRPELGHGGNVVVETGGAGGGDSSSNITKAEGGGDGNEGTELGRDGGEAGDNLAEESLDGALSRVGEAELSKRGQGLVEGRLADRGNKGTQVQARAGRLKELVTVRSGEDSIEGAEGTGDNSGVEGKVRVVTSQGAALGHLNSRGELGARVLEEALGGSVGTADGGNAEIDNSDGLDASSDEVLSGASNNGEQSLGGGGSGDVNNGKGGILELNTLLANDGDGALNLGEGSLSPSQDLLGLLSGEGGVRGERGLVVVGGDLDKLLLGEGSDGVNGDQRALGAASVLNLHAANLEPVKDRLYDIEANLNIAAEEHAVVALGALIINDAAELAEEDLHANREASHVADNNVGEGVKVFALGQEASEDDSGSHGDLLGAGELKRKTLGDGNILVSLSDSGNGSSNAGLGGLNDQHTSSVLGSVLDGEGDGEGVGDEEDIIILSRGNLVDGGGRGVRGLGKRGGLSKGLLSSLQRSLGSDGVSGLSSHLALLYGTLTDEIKGVFGESEHFLYFVFFSLFEID